MIGRIQVHLATRVILLACLILAPLSRSSADEFRGVWATEKTRTCFDAHLSPLRSHLWGVGTLGASCKAEGYGDPLRTTLYYSNFIVDERKLEFNDSRIDERNLTAKANEHIVNYGVQLANLIDQLAYDFLKSRENLEASARQNKPISTEEMKYWQLFVKIVAYQEFLFSHYQFEDSKATNDLSRLRITVGDPHFLRDSNGIVVHNSKGQPIQAVDQFGNLIFDSTGTMQIHKSSATELSETTYDLVKNISKGISHVYAHWAALQGLRPFDSKKTEAQYNEQCRSLVFTKKSIHYDNLMRAAYGMYNAGEGGVCRFVESDKRYTKYVKENPHCDVDKMAYSPTKSEGKSPAKTAEQVKEICENKQKTCGPFVCPWVNDIRIRRFISNTPWEKRLGIKDESRYQRFTSHGNYKFDFNLDCMREGGHYCLLADARAEGLSDLKSGRLDQQLFTLNQPSEKTFSKINFCVYERDKNNIVCTSQEKLVPCLRNRQNFSLLTLTDVSGKKVRASYFTLHQIQYDSAMPTPTFVDDVSVLCSGENDGVFGPGQTIQLLKDSNIRKSSDLSARVLGTLMKGRVLQILDVEIKPENGLTRWYRVSGFDKKAILHEGYVYGGDELSWREILRPSAITNIKMIVIPRVGDRVQLKMNRPIVNFNASGETQPTANIMARDAELVVKSVKLAGRDQLIYLEIGENSQGLPPNSGFISIGQIRTNSKTVQDSVSNFITITQLRSAGPQ